MVQEDGIGLMTVIKGTCKYRRSRRRDFVSDFLPPSMTELKYVRDQVFGYCVWPSTFSFFPAHHNSLVASMQYNKAQSNA